MPGPFPFGEILSHLGWCFGGTRVVGLDALNGWVGLPSWCSVYICVYVYMYVYTCM